MYTPYEIEERRTKTVENLIAYLNGTNEMNLTDFFKHIERHDKFRLENFAETFPEFYQLLSKYKTR